MRVLNLVLTVLFQSARALGRSRSDLILENLALRQQIAVLASMKHRARFCGKRVLLSRAAGSEPATGGVPIELASPPGL